MAVELSSGRIRLRCDRSDCQRIFTPHSARLTAGQADLLRDLAWLQGWRVRGGLTTPNGEPSPEDFCPEDRPRE